MAELKNLERDLDRFNTRLLVAALFVLVCFGLLGWRLVVLQVVRHEELALQAEAKGGTRIAYCGDPMLETVLVVKE